MVVVGGVITLGSLPLVFVGRPLARIWVGSGLVPPLSLFVTLAAYTVYITVVSQASVLLLVTQRLKVLAIVGVLPDTGQPRDLHTLHAMVGAGRAGVRQPDLARPACSADHSRGVPPTAQRAGEHCASAQRRRAGCPVRGLD